ncbi:MAG TPA: hypothetical protein P5016_03665 [Verrucomicrobiales bacterium]|nr:hypothetical protein [Verrucomicrobiae bacterium]MCP5552400.1 hypothetical protein [Akkermansiaceae bacterium]HRX53576.1 hypothetical protein [Verrucomicrobiales bacterium]
MSKQVGFEKGGWHLVAGACLGICLALGQTGCLSTQTVKTKSSSYTFLGHEDDSKKIKAKFGGGYSYSPTGEVITERKSPFAVNKMLPGMDREMGDQSFRNPKKDLGSKAYKTPDYLVRNKDVNAKKAWGVDASARESDMDRHLAAGVDSEAKTKEAWGFDKLFRSKKAAGVDRQFATSDRGEYTRAQQNAAIPDPAPGPSAANNYSLEKRLTMDDVRKMLHPEQAGGS